MQLYVGGLSDDKTEDDVEEVFLQACLPQSVTIIRDIDSDESRGFAIVKIPGAEKGEEAIRHLDGTTMRERISWLEECQTRYPVK